MTEINTLLLLFFVETLLVCLVVLLVIVALSMVRKRRERAAVRGLISRIKDDDERRHNETRELLQQCYFLPPETAEAVADEMGREEKRLYQALINLYLRRDASALANINTVVEATLAPYRKLPIPAPGDKSVQDDQTADLEHLRDENERLKTELGVTMETMGRMLNEYSSMYGGGNREDQPSDSQGVDSSNEPEAPSVPSDKVGAVSGVMSPDGGILTQDGDGPHASLDQGEWVSNAEQADDLETEPELAAIQDQPAAAQPKPETDDHPDETADNEQLLAELHEEFDMISDELQEPGPDLAEPLDESDLGDELVALDDDLDFVFDTDEENKQSG
ncbi:MAG: hypothetical protein KDI63_07960 [Gammaproteobacteria bacterium]|nr:hypothetical protein [Gammaproteobacteria bacterium]